jgi:hypothetical protein
MFIFGLKPFYFSNSLHLFELFRHAQYTHRHAVFSHRVGHVVPEPARVQTQGRRVVENVGVAPLSGALLEVGHGAFGHQEGATRVNLVHQVKLLHASLLGPREADGARVVDDYVNASKMLHSLQYFFCFFKWKQRVPRNSNKKQDT